MIPIIISAAVLLLFYDLTTVLAQAPNEPVDDFIVCQTGKPANVILGNNVFPQGYDPHDYMNNMDLCSAVYGKVDVGPPEESRNIGCECFAPGSILNCWSNLADQNLFYHQLNGDPRWRNFREYCIHQCRCTTAEISASLWDQDMQSEAIFEPLIGSNGTKVGTASYDPTAGVEPWEESLPGYQAGHYTGGAEHRSSSNDASEEVCGGSCDSQRNCAGYPDDCTCRAHSTMVEPGSMAVYTLSLCLGLSLSLGGGTGRKRDEPDPCPCNASYVSYGCCSSPDGLIWEAPEMKLGELLVQDDLK